MSYHCQPQPYRSSPQQDAFDTTDDSCIGWQHMFSPVHSSQHTTELGHQTALMGRRTQIPLQEDQQNALARNSPYTGMQDLLCAPDISPTFDDNKAQKQSRQSCGGCGAGYVASGKCRPDRCEFCTWIEAELVLPPVLNGQQPALSATPHNHRHLTSAGGGSSSEQSLGPQDSSVTTSNTVQPGIGGSNSIVTPYTQLGANGYSQQPQQPTAQQSAAAAAGNTNITTPAHKGLPQGVTSFTTVSAAVAYMANANPIVPLIIQNDDYNNYTPHARQMAIDDVYHALYHPGDAAPAGWTQKKSTAYTDAQTENLAAITESMQTADGKNMASAMASLAVTAVEDVHALGIPKKELDKIGEARMDTTSVFTVRMAAVIRAIQGNKKVAWDLLRGEDIDTLAQRPKLCVKRKERNMQGNGGKQVLLDLGKAARDAATGAEAAATSQVAGVHTAAGASDLDAPAEHPAVQALMLPLATTASRISANGSSQPMLTGQSNHAPPQIFQDMAPMSVTQSNHLGNNGAAPNALPINTDAVNNSHTTTIGASSSSGVATHPGSIFATNNGHLQFASHVLYHIGVNASNNPEYSTSQFPLPQQNAFPNSTNAVNNSHTPTGGASSSSGVATNPSFVLSTNNGQVQPPSHVLHHTGGYPPNNPAHNILQVPLPQQAQAPAAPPGSATGGNTTYNIPPGPGLPAGVTSFGTAAAAQAHLDGSDPYQVQTITGDDYHLFNAAGQTAAVAAAYHAILAPGDPPDPSWSTEQTDTYNEAHTEVTILMSTSAGRLKASAQATLTIEAINEVHTRGIRASAFRVRTKESRPDVSMIHSVRLQSVIDAIRRSKRVSLDVLEGKKLQALAQRPVKCIERKQANLSNNWRKKGRLDAGKVAMEGGLVLVNGSSRARLTNAGNAALPALPPGGGGPPSNVPQPSNPGPHAAAPTLPLPGTNIPAPAAAMDALWSNLATQAAPAGQIQSSRATGPHTGSGAPTTTTAHHPGSSIFQASSSSRDQLSSDGGDFAFLTQPGLLSVSINSQSQNAGTNHLPPFHDHISRPTQAHSSSLSPAQPTGGQQTPGSPSSPRSDLDSNPAVGRGVNSQYTATPASLTQGSNQTAVAGARTSSTETTKGKKRTIYETEQGNHVQNIQNKVARREESETSDSQTAPSMGFGVEGLELDHSTDQMFEAGDLFAFDPTIPQSQNAAMEMPTLNDFSAQITAPITENSEPGFVYDTSIDDLLEEYWPFSSDGNGQLTNDTADENHVEAAGDFNAPFTFDGQFDWNNFSMAMPDHFNADFGIE